MIELQHEKINNVTVHHDKTLINLGINSDPEVIKIFMLNSTEHEISTEHKNSNTDIFFLL